MTNRFRLFPLVAVTALFIMGVKATDFVRENDISLTSINVAVAQEKAPDSAMEKAKAEGDDAKKTAEKKPKKGKKEPEAVVEQTLTNLSKSEIALLEALSKRRIEHEKREIENNLKDKLLEAAEQRIDEKIAKLEELNKIIEANKVQQEEMRNGQFKNLVSIYEGMKPKDAARIFSGLNGTILLQVAERMAPRKMSAIMAKMQAAAAERLTIQLANKAAGARRKGQELPRIEDGKAN